MKIDVRTVDPIAYFDEAASLLAANWKESGSPIKFIAHDVRKLYGFLSASNVLFAVAAFMANKLVGYAVITISPHPLNNSVIVCDCSGVYLLPSLRGKKVVSEMMRVVRILSKEHKASYAHWHAPAGSRFSKALAKRFTPLSNYFIEKL